jgi:hypothetical protein
MTRSYVKKYQYFTLPLASVPTNPQYEKLWFACWSSHHPDVTWSTERPSLHPDATSSWAVGLGVIELTEGGKPPAEATIIIPESSKCIDPPPLSVPPTITTMAEFATELAQKLARKLDNIRSA